MALIKPPALHFGDTVGIVAPGSNIQRDDLRQGCEALRRLGYKPFYLDSIFDRDLYFAGSVERRVRELHEMFEREEVRAILCARGGYGCNYLLEHLDLELVRRHPKILVGYSDVTALLTWVHDQTGLVTFHGPMVAKDFTHDDGIHVESWHAAVEGEESWQVSRESGICGLVSGVAKGPLYGGCLSILAASLGTKYEIAPPAEAIFLFEDRGEKPYQIDRLLMQLALAGKFEGARGFVFGEMRDCAQPGGQDYTLEQVVVRVLSERCPGVPVAFGLRSGHVSRANVTLPMGVHVLFEVEGKEARLAFRERAVASQTAASEASQRART